MEDTVRKKKKGKIIVVVLLIVGIAISLLLWKIFSGKEVKNHFAKEKIELTIKPYHIERFDEDFLHINPSPNTIKGDMEKLRAKYGDFLDMYTINVLTIGPATSDQSMGYIREFLQHKGYHAYYMAVDSVYKNGLQVEEEEMTQGFNRFHHFFPNRPLPRKILSIFSAFYGNMCVEEKNLDLGLSLDYYLGSDYANYKWVDGISDYQRPNLRREKLAPDALMGWIMYELPEMEKENPKLIDEMVYQGKVLYLTQACLPDQTNENLMGYSPEQIAWCKANEGKMWQEINSNKHLYTYDRLTITKYINPAPFTAFFPQESPGKAGIWIGWQIVNSYMKNNPKVGLDQLVKESDGQKILEKSGYNPTHTY